MANRIISFSKDSGVITGNDRTLTLSKSSDAKDFEIRYTTDGSIPRHTSDRYEHPLQLDNKENTVVRAALFYNEQRVSPVYTKKYIAKSIKIQDVTVSHTEDWGNNYVKAGMIDQNTSTRWASKNVERF